MGKRLHRISLIFLTLMLLFIWAINDLEVNKLWAIDRSLSCNKNEILTIARVTVWALSGKKAFFFKAGMDIDADGAPDAYHPSNKGRDYLENAGSPGNWWGIVTDNGQPNGEPVIQRSNDPFPGYYISKTALEDPTKPKNNPTRYVDASKIPYIVLPPQLTLRNGRNVGANLGDMAVVINAKNRKYSCAIFADIGPRKKIGEGSIALADTLGIPSDPKKGGTKGDVIYVVFPGSGNRMPRSIQDINSEGVRLFQSWGGMAQIDACFSQ